MTNNVNKSVEYVKDFIDEIIVAEAKTAGLRADPALVRASNRAGTIEIATASVGSLGDYSTATGYAAGDVALTWQAVNLAHDRSIKFTVDRREENETDQVATAARFAAELTRLHVIPEVDATRIAACAAAVSASGAISGHAVTETTTNLNNKILEKIGDGLDVVIDATGIDEGHDIYINNAIMSYLRKTTEVQKTKEVTAGSHTLDLDTNTIDGNRLIRMPSARMFAQLTYSSSSSTAGFTGTDIVNYVITTPGCVQGVVAFDAPKFIPKEVNQTFDGDTYAYRILHDAFVPKEKVAGIYVSRQSVTP